MGQLFKTMEDAQDVDFEKDQQLKAVTVQINDFGISPTDLKITTAQKDKLIEIGYTATIQYFEGQSQSVHTELNFGGELQKRPAFVGFVSLSKLKKIP